MEDQGCNYQRAERFPLPVILYIVCTSIEAVVGMSLNAFIAVVNCIDGMRNGHLKSIDKILTAFGVSRCFYMCLLVIKIFWIAFFPWIFEYTSLYQTYKATTWFLNCTNLCFTACLCTFYCAKIANFQHYIFFLLKTRISRLVPWMLLASLLGSLATTSPFFKEIYIFTCQNYSSFDILGNVTLEGFTVETDLVHLFLWCGLGFTVAFFISTTSTFLLLFSLWRHTQQMQNSSASFSSPSMAAHFQAVKIIISLLVINVINFVSLMVLLSNRFLDSSLASRFCAIILNACPSVQSSLLIWGNPKLKREFGRVVHYIRYMFLFGKGVMRDAFCLPSKMIGSVSCIPNTHSYSCNPEVRQVTHEELH
ncbi:taste receptor type 2 member 40-like [Podarcis muralis]